MLLLVAYFSFTLFFFSLFLASYEILLNQTCYDFFFLRPYKPAKPAQKPKIGLLTVFPMKSYFLS